MKRVPHFWWDFRYEPDQVIVESNDDKHKLVASWPGHSRAAQAKAERLLIALREGRADYRRLAKSHIMARKKT